jgi:hypothetical protein
MTSAPRLPTFVIVGAAKCGTSSLAAYLADHPEAYVVPEKELHFFTREWDRGLDWYRQCFAGAGDRRAIGEATPTYLAEPVALRRMAEVLPQARIIAMVRNPIDRAYSHYWHWHGRQGERRTFEEAIADELAAGPGGDTTPSWDAEHPQDYAYLAFGCYVPQLDRLCRHFSREQVLVVVFDDLERQPQETFRTVCRFLDIDQTIVPESVGTVVNPYRYYQPAWLWNLFVRVRIGRFVPGRVGAAIYRKMVRVAEPYPPMDPALRRRLSEYFAQDIEALEEWLERDLSAWR